VSYLYVGIFVRTSEKLHKIECISGKGYKGYLGWYKDEVIRVRREDVEIKKAEAAVAEAKTGETQEEESFIDAIGDLAALIIAAKLEMNAEEKKELERLRKEDPDEYRRVTSLDPERFKEYIESKRREKDLLDADAAVVSRKVEVATNETALIKEGVEQKKIQEPISKPKSKAQLEREKQKEKQKKLAKMTRQIDQRRQELVKQGIEGEDLEFQLDEYKQRIGFYDL